MGDWCLLCFVAFMLLASKAGANDVELPSWSRSDTVPVMPHNENNRHEGENQSSRMMVSRRDQFVVQKDYTQSLDPDGTLSYSVSYNVVHASEAEPKDLPTDTCGRTNKFHGHVLVEHGLKDTDNITDHALYLLETTFRETYNSLNMPKVYNNVCDKNHLRVIDDVKVTVSDVIYKKLEGETLSVRNFIYQISGHGVGVSNDISIFDMQTVESVAPYMHEPYDPWICNCANNVEEARAPTDKNFKQAFAKEIKILTQLKALENIKTVGEVIEHDAVECKRKDREFYTDVVVAFAEEPTQRDFTVLGDTFQNSYNHLTVNYCDPEFRVVADIQVEEMEDDRRRRLRGLVDRNKQLRRRLRFRVRGKCKGCRRRSHLFNDASDKGGDRRRRFLKWFSNDNEEDDGEPDRGDDQRSLQGYKDYFDWHHDFGGKDVCFCVSHPKGIRPPSNSEFESRYSRELYKAIASENYHIELIKEWGNN